jgi:cytochrome c-type protein NapB
MLKHSLMAMAALGMFTLSAAAGDKVVNINEGLNNPDRIAKEDLGNKKKTYDETALLLNKAEDVALPEVKYDRPAPGTAPKFERAYVNAPPLIPHSVDGLLPITKSNNACLSCHMPDVAKASGATPIPPSHFTNFRPDTGMKDGKVVKEGKVVGPDGDIGNTGDIKLAKVKKLNHLYQGRYNCSQCHVPQANIDTPVDNTFEADFGKDGELKTKSNLIDVMNEGVQ